MEPDPRIGPTTTVVKRPETRNIGRCRRILHRPHQTRFSPACASSSEVFWCNISSAPSSRARIIFSTIIDYSCAAYKAIIFSLKVSRHNIREIRGGEVLGPMGREFYVLSVSGLPPIPPTRKYHHPATLLTQSLQPKNSLPNGPKTSPLLTSLMLSQKTFRLI